MFRSVMAANNVREVDDHIGPLGSPISSCVSFAASAGTRRPPDLPERKVILISVSIKVRALHAFRNRNR